MIPAALRRGLILARLTLTLERLWPSVALAFGLLALFLVYAWSSLALLMPTPVRVIILGVFFAAFVAIIFQTFRISLPSDREVLRHLDGAAPNPHQHAQTLLDEPSGASTTQIADALWRAHQKTSADTLPSNLMTKWRSNLTERDHSAH